MDPKLVGTISVFNSVKKVDEAQIKKDPSFNWFVSHIDDGKRTCNSFGRCFIPFHECLFTRLRLRLPFSGFEEELLNRLYVTTY